MKQEYLDNINLEKESRIDMLKCFHVETIKTTSIINRFLGREPKPVNFKHLTTLFKANEWVNVNDKVKFKLIEFNDSEAIYDTEMQRNGSFGKHYHDDCLEVVEVLSGLLFDVTNEEVYEKGDVFFIEAKQQHTPVALENTKLKVKFIKV